MFSVRDFDMHVLLQQWIHSKLCVSYICISTLWLFAWLEFGYMSKFREKWVSD